MINPARTNRIRPVTQEFFLKDHGHENFGQLGILNEEEKDGNDLKKVKSGNGSFGGGSPLGLGADFESESVPGPDRLPYCCGAEISR